jgi:hypothetical protein
MLLNINSLPPESTPTASIDKKNPLGKLFLCLGIIATSGCSGGRRRMISGEFFSLFPWFLG